MIFHETLKEKWHFTIPTGMGIVLMQTAHCEKARCIMIHSKIKITIQRGGGLYFKVYVNEIFLNFISFDMYEYI